MSSTPPKPGSQRLESLQPTSRFSSDSARSPIMPTPPSSRPKGSQPQLGPLGRSPSQAGTSQVNVAHDARQEKSRAPMAPSIVFFGLRAGAILWRPRVVPEYKRRCRPP